MTLLADWAGCTGQASWAGQVALPRACISLSHGAAGTTVWGPRPGGLTVPWPRAGSPWPGGREVAGVGPAQRGLPGPGYRGRGTTRLHGTLVIWWERGNRPRSWAAGERGWFPGSHFCDGVPVGGRPRGSAPPVVAG